VTALTQAQREAKVRAVLTTPPTVPASEASRELGMDRATFGRIRRGRLWADVLPELERWTSEQSARLCHHCTQWEPSTSRAGGDRQGRCMLGIPECRSEGQIWAKGCGAFARRS